MGPVQHRAGARSCAAVAALLILMCGLALSAAPALADSPLSWSAPVPIDTPNTLSAVSCPSASMCVAVDDVGSVVTTADPVSGPWAVTLVEPTSFFELDAISCPSTSLCVAGDLSDGLLTSTNPTGGAADWTRTTVAGTLGFYGVSCPSTNLCAAITEEGNVATSTDPTAAAPVWTITDLNDANILNGISCASESLCVATDLSGDVLTSTNPTGGAAAWTFTHVDSGGLYGVSCPSDTLCAAVDQVGNVLTATDPTGGAAAWTSASIDVGRALHALSCPSTSMCVAADNQGGVVTTTNPTGGAGAWTATQVAATNDFLYGTSCGSPSLCVVTDGNGNAITGTSGAPPARTLSVAVGGTGSGAVTGDQPPQIACPGTCSQQYPSGTVVTLTETPSAGSAFAGWSGGGCSGTAPTCQVTLNSDTSVTATFNATQMAKLTLTIAGDGSGFVQPGSSPTCYHLNPRTPPTTCTTFWPVGAIVTLHATPSGTSSFGGWLSPCFTATGDCTVTMNGDQSVTALFNAQQSLTATAAGTGTGEVYDNYGHTCFKTSATTTPASCPWKYTYGTVVTLHAAPSAGSTFAGWSGSCSGTGACSVNMLGARAVTATFAYDPGVHVNAIEVTQGVQTPELPTRSATNPSGFRVSYSGVPLPWSNGVPQTVELAQDHATVVRVYVNTGLDRHGAPVPTMVLRAYRDGKELAPGPIAPDQVPPSSAVPIGPLANITGAQRYSPTGAYTYTLPWGWARGDIDLVADANPSPSTFPACSAVCQERAIVLQGVHFNAVTFAVMDPVAIQDTANASPQDLPLGDTASNPVPDPAWAQVQALTPFPIYVPAYVTTLNETKTIAASKSAGAAGTQISADILNWANANDSSSSDYPFGIAPKADCGTVGGSTYLSPRVLYGSAQPISVARECRPLTSVAHEFNHGLGRPHAGQICGSNSNGQVGEPWPPIPPNDGAFDGVGLNTNGSYPYQIIAPGTAAAPVFDLMSYCGSVSDGSFVGNPPTFVPAVGVDHWISVRNWNRMVDFHAPPQVRRRSASAPATYQTDPPADPSDTHSLAITAVDSLSSGKVTTIDVAGDASAPTASGASAYSLSARNSAGQVIATAGATASPLHIDPDPGDLVLTGKIAAAGVSEIDVLHNGQPIGHVVASPHAPTVTILSPSLGSRVGGPRGAVLKWRSSDADGGPLEVIVRYSLNGGRIWQTVYAGPDQGTVHLPSHVLGASRNARVRLYVSDGFNEAIATSRRFTALGAPPIVSIADPRNRTRVIAGASLNVSGSAYDDAGHRLTGHALVWRAGRQLLGYGTQITTVELAPGRHTITLSASDRSRRTAHASASVTVLPAPPVVTMLKAPHRISRKARYLRLRIATLAPATLVVSRFHVPIGRRARVVRVRITPSRRTLNLDLVLRSGPYVSRIPVTVQR